MILYKYNTKLINNRQIYKQYKIPINQTGATATPTDDGGFIIEMPLDENKIKHDVRSFPTKYVTPL